MLYQLHVSLEWSQRPSDGVHTLHPVGRQSGTHLDNGLAVASIPRGKEWLNGKVNRPST